MSEIVVRDCVLVIMTHIFPEIRGPPKPNPRFD